MECGVVGSKSQVISHLRVIFAQNEGANSSCGQPWLGQYAGAVNTSGRRTVPQLIGALGRCFKHHWADCGFGLVSGGLHVEIE